MVEVRHHPVKALLEPVAIADDSLLQLLEGAC